MSSRRSIRDWRSEDGGQALVLLASMLLTMLFAVGLAIDAGQLFVAKRTIQEAADAAAFAGAVQFYLDGTINKQVAIDAAIADAQLNGFQDNVNDTTVTVTSPPSTGPAAGNLFAVEVVILRQVRTALVPAQAQLNQVRARSVAQAAPFASPYAIVALGNGTGPCITVSGTGGIAVPASPSPRGGAIQANCTGTSIDLSGGGGINDSIGTSAAGTVNVPGRVTGPLTTNAPRQRDPFAGFPKPPAPTPYTQNQSPYSIPSTTCSALTPLPPGVYNGGLINTNTCANTYLGTGVFVLRGGGLNQNAQTGNTITNVPGGGVMIFNTHSNYPGIPGTCGSIQAQQGGKIDITAMTQAQSQQYYGMGIYQDGACTNSIDVASNGALNIHGTLYAPTANLGIQSQSSGTIDAQIVVATINLGANGTLTVNYNPSGSAQTQLPALVE
jgi:hypothetical protein